ncbi:MAG: hypothetical protein ABL982_23680, partial [Vicinamibacterales bacterium]
MDEAVFGFGLCCTAVPVIAAVVIAWMARGRAEEAIKRADMTMHRLELLQRQLQTMRTTLPQAIGELAPRGGIGELAPRGEIEAPREEAQAAVSLPVPVPVPEPVPVPAPAPVPVGLPSPRPSPP